MNTKNIMNLNLLVSSRVLRGLLLRFESELSEHEMNLLKKIDDVLDKIRNEENNHEI